MRSILTDSFGRQITYLRLSLTDRCNFRCTYCMPEKMQFSPRNQNLSVDELIIVAQAFVELGVTKIRLTGGEPLIHPDVDQLLYKLNALKGLKDIALTTNGSHIANHLESLALEKVTQLNISLDSLQPNTFSQITRQKPEKLTEVLKGIKTAKSLGIKRIRLNVVLMKGLNDHELFEMINFAQNHGVHIAFIEEMPLGDMNGLDRAERHLPHDALKKRIQERHQLTHLIKHQKSAGPAEYYRLDNTASEVGFISPHSNNFCSTCNRVRVTRTGKLILCLGNNEAVDLKRIIQNSGQSSAMKLVKEAVLSSIEDKPESHHFDLDDTPQILRWMNVTGG